MDFHNLSKSIMKLDTKIRLVTICDLDGKIKFSSYRPGVKNLLTPTQSKNALDMAVKAWKARIKLAPRIGHGKYVLAEYEKIKRITMPVGRNHLIYVTTEVGANHSKIISGIQKLTK